MEIEKNSKVSVEYTGTLEDGSVFDSNVGKEPLKFLAGTGMVIKGFDDAVLGKSKDDEIEVKIEPRDAYGEKNEQLVQTIPLNAIPEKIPKEIGVVMQIKFPDGNMGFATIINIEGETVTIDMNHPLAGQTLNFKIKIISVEEASKEEIEHGHIHN
ncbi:MAG TPA: peptidylprolyl isomerase [Candidatus Woesearchaeota archaeon]|nr:peptidylprolyl isomerase [Candidatus Woesearchaeota archaeon]